MARPSKLTEDVKNTIVDAILHGCTYADAAGAAGVHYDTFNNWMQAGAKAKSGQYFEFFEAVSTANAECAKNFTRIIQVAAAKGDWKAALEWLKRRRPVDWGDASRVDVTTDGEKLPAINVYIPDNGRDKTTT